MDDGIYYEQINVSSKLLDKFELLYNNQKKEIIKDLKVIIKEKYNIDIIEHGEWKSDDPGIISRSIK